jgi:hypothetical protein
MVSVQVLELADGFTGDFQDEAADIVLLRCAEEYFESRPWHGGKHIMGNTL